MKFFTIRRPDGSPIFTISRLFSLRGRVAQVHRFVSADAKECFHTHPATRAIRIVLWGGYVEELTDGTKVTWWPGRIGLVRHDLEHRIDRLLNGRSSISLWLRGRIRHNIDTRGC